MPSINVGIQQHGALLPVFVSLSFPRMTALRESGAQIPAGASGTFLVDTGASGTCVDPTLVAKLGLVPTGSVAIQTPSTNGTPFQCNQFDVSLFIPGAVNEGGFLIGALPIFETPLASQGIDGLLGRDVLDRCTLVYNGSAHIFTLAY